MTVFKIEDGRQKTSVDYANLAEAATDMRSTALPGLTQEEDRERRRSFAAGLTIFLAAVAIFVLACAMSGCTTVSSAAQKELQTGSQVGQGLFRDWEKLSPAEQRQSFWAITRILVDLDYSIMSTPVPPAFVGPYAAVPK